MSGTRQAVKLKHASLIKGNKHAQVPKMQRPAQAQGAGAPSAALPLASQSSSCLRLYGSAARPIACTMPNMGAQRSG